MTTNIKLKRGTAAAIRSYTGTAGEALIDTTNWGLVVCDGKTAGGYHSITTINNVRPDSNGNVDIVGLPLGFEYFQTNPNIRAGSIPLTGGLYSRELYADFQSWIQQQSGYLISEAEQQAKANTNGGAVPFYSDGDGSTSFRVPALTVWVKGKNGDEAVGDYLADEFKSHKHNVSVSLTEAGGHTHTRGTMNITGRVEGYGDRTGFGNGNTNGAFYGIQWQERLPTMGDIVSGYNSILIAGFDASRTWTGETSSNGNHSHTVTLTEATQGGSETRPKTIVGLYCVIAFTTATLMGSVNLDSLQQSINEARVVVEAADGFLHCEPYGSVRNRDASKPTYGLS